MEVASAEGSSDADGLFSTRVSTRSVQGTSDGSRRPTPVVSPLIDGVEIEVPSPHGISTIATTPEVAAGPPGPVGGLDMHIPSLAGIAATFVADGVTANKMKHEHSNQLGCTRSHNSPAQSWVHLRVNFVRKVTPLGFPDLGLMGHPHSPWHQVEDSLLQWQEF